MTEDTRRLPALIEWFSRTRAIADASKLALDAEQRFCLGRSAEALVVADQLLELARVEDSRGTTSAAITMYREALYWALRALDPLAAKEEPASLEALFRKIPRRRLADLAGGSNALLALDDALVRDGFTATARLAPDAQMRVAEAAKTFAHGAFDEAERPDKRLARFVRQRVRRPFGVIAFVLGIAAISVIADAILNAPPDLANDRPFIVSDTVPSYPATGHANRHIIDGAFFHTNERMNPWVRVDLGRVRPISVVTVENRRNCCKERAVPLQIEVSTNGNDFRSVAYRQEQFETWEARFPTTLARYVRLRVRHRNTMFHLAGIHVYER